ncbi:unnamed protein product, partial [marine sediment metagenome]
MMLRRKALVFIVTLLVTASLLTVLTGCSGITQAIIGSGNLITQEMDFTDFTKLEISHVFQAKVIRSDSFSVGITVDDNLLEYVVVRKSGNTLRIYLKAGYAYIGTTKMVEITMPKIDKLSLSGASRVEVSGFRSSDRLELEASGVSSLNIDDLKAGDTVFEISGGSHAVGSIEIANGRFNVSGASSIDLEGYASDISIEASEASHANLADFSVSNATVTISGASLVTVNASGTIDGNVSGASRLTYLGDPALTIEMS